MSLPLLYNTPISERDWNVWSLSHAASHKKIIQALKAKNISVVQYQFDPMNLSAFEQFLNRNQQAHNDMVGALGIPGSDLTGLDPKNKNQLRAWIAGHAREHHDVEAALGI